MGEADPTFKILILIKSLGLGGAERLLVDSLPYLDRQRFAYHFAYILPWKNFLEPHFAQAGFPVYCLGRGNGVTRANGKPSSEAGVTPANSLSAAALLPLAGWRLNRLVQQERFDLIHADLPLTGILARLVGRQQGVPVIYTEHNLQERYHPLTRWANRATYRWNQQVFTVSEEVTESLQRAGMGRNTTIHTLLNGIPVEQVRAEASDAEALRTELGIPAEHRVVGSVAVFRRQKRLTDWLEVARKVATQREDVSFLLVGDGPEMPVVRSKIRELGLEGRVILPGFRENGRRLMGVMDIYLMSSEHEGLPIAMLEAMALGKPIVATDVGGIPEVVKEGESGFLAAVGAVDELAHHVLRLLDNSSACKRMGEAGARTVETHFHLEQRVQAIEARYHDLLNSDCSDRERS